MGIYIANKLHVCGMIQSYLFTIKTESVYPKARPFWGNFGIFTGQL